MWCLLVVLPKPGSEEGVFLMLKCMKRRRVRRRKCGEGQIRPSSYHGLVGVLQADVSQTWLRKTVA
jgi:hypothetical protein